MTECKKDYIIDALGELEDSYIEEAVTYVKRKFSWRYTKELGALAACAAVVFLSVSAYRMLPFGASTENTTGAAREEIAKEEQAQAEVTMEGSSMEVAPESSTVTDSANGTNSAAGSALDRVEAKEQEAVEVLKDYNSKGVQWEVIEPGNAEAEIYDKMNGASNVHESIGSANQESQVVQQNSSCVRWMSAEEILALDTEIFMGTVADKQVCRVTGGMSAYFTVITVEVEEVIRGSQVVGGTCLVYLPCAVTEDVSVINSLTGDLDKLEIGSRAIFMPYCTDKETGQGSGDVWLSYADFADYYFGEGMRFLFLETEDGVSYEQDVYEVPSEGKVTLEDVAEYIRSMLK